jgi:hypothetical protein
MHGSDREKKMIIDQYNSRCEAFQTGRARGSGDPAERPSLEKEKRVIWLMSTYVSFTYKG